MDIRTFGKFEEKPPARLNQPTNYWSSRELRLTEVNSQNSSVLLAGYPTQKWIGRFDNLLNCLKVSLPNQIHTTQTKNNGVRISPPTMDDTAAVMHNLRNRKGSEQDIIGTEPYLDTTTELLSVLAQGGKRTTPNRMRR